MSELVEFIQRQERDFNLALTDNGIVWGKECQFAVQAFQANDFLFKTASNNPDSARNAIINVAAIGITLNPAAKLAYLVPRDGRVCLDISYMGLLHIAQQSGSILWGQCKLVYANDHYENQGLDVQPLHRYQAFGERGDIIGGYCTVKTASGDYLTEEMSIADIRRVEATSKAKNGPWKNFWEEMARKTIVKRASKYWPKVDRLDRAIDVLNTDNGEGLASSEEQDISPASDEAIANVQAMLEERFSDPSKTSDWVSGFCKRNVAGYSDLTQQEAEKIINALENSR